MFRKLQDIQNGWILVLFFPKKNTSLEKKLYKSKRDGWETENLKKTTAFSNSKGSHDIPTGTKKK